MARPDRYGRESVAFCLVRASGRPRLLPVRHSLALAVSCLTGLLLGGCEGELGPSWGAGTGTGRLTDTPGERTNAPDTSGTPTSPSVCTPGAPVAPSAGPAAPLTDAQLRSALQDLFPFEVSLPALPDRPRARHAFSSNATANAYSLTAVQRMTEAGEVVAAQAYDAMEALLPCAPSALDEACADRFIQNFAGRAYRRPLAGEEREGLLAVYRRVASDSGDSALAVSAVIATVLQTPQFLYQLSLGDPATNSGPIALTSHEVAARLSLLLTDGPPDATLRELADADALTDRANVATQADRLLATPAGQAVLDRFVLEWFDIADVDNSGRVGRSLSDAMREEVARDLRSWLGERGDFAVTGLLRADTTYVNAELSAHYGLPDGLIAELPDPTAFTEVTLPPQYQGGMLSKAMVSARYSNLEAPSVILRGVFVLTELLCLELGTPPLDAVDRNPRLPEGALPREKVEARGMLNPCGSCHSVIDPVGLGMEDLDQLGRYRSEYAPGIPVDRAGALPLGDAPTFEGVAQLAQRLADSETFAQCATAQWLEHATGQAPTRTNGGKCSAETLTEQAGGSSATVRDMVVAFVTSDQFMLRRREPTQ